MTLPPYHLVQILRSRMYHEIELNKAYSWPLGLKIGRNRRILWTSKLELEQHNVTLPYSRIPDSAITKGTQTLNPHSLTNHEIDGGKEIRKGWRGHLQGDDVPDDEAVVYGDGEEARVGEEAAWARLLVRLRELHPLLPLTRLPEADLRVTGNGSESSRWPAAYRSGEVGFGLWKVRIGDLNFLWG